MLIAWFFLLSCRTYIVNYWWRFLLKVRQPRRQLPLPLLSTSHDAAAASYSFIVLYLLLQPLVLPRRSSLFLTSFCLHFLTLSLHMFPNRPPCSASLSCSSPTFFVFVSFLIRLPLLLLPWHYPFFCQPFLFVSLKLSNCDVRNCTFEL